MPDGESGKVISAAEAQVMVCLQHTADVCERLQDGVDGEEWWRQLPEQQRRQAWARFQHFRAGNRETQGTWEKACALAKQVGPSAGCMHSQEQAARRQ